MRTPVNVDATRASTTLLAVAAFACAVAACGGSERPAVEASVQASSSAAKHDAAPPPQHALRKQLDEAAAGVDSPALAQLLREHWRHYLRSYPIEATRLGVHAYDARVMDRSASALAERHAAEQRFVARAVALRREQVSEREQVSDGEQVSDRDQVTVVLFVDRLRASIDTYERCRFHQWSFSARDNPVTEWNNLPEVHTVKTVADGRRLIARYRAAAEAIDQDIANLRTGLAVDLVVNAETARRALKMVDRQLAQPLDAWPLMAPAKVEHADWPEQQRSLFKKMLYDAVAQQIRPALRRYRALLAGEIIPAARDEAHSGLSALSIGAACYQARVRANVTLELTPDAIHRIGLDEIRRLDKAIAALGKSALGRGSLAETLAALRQDRNLYFQTAAQVKSAAEDILRDAKAVMPKYFGRLPKADCVVRPIPAYEARYTTIAYYRPPHADGSKPGEYFVNVHAPTTRPRFEARVLGIHEAIFGHHLQIAIAQELGEVPAFRKHGHVTAYVEGWALYSERLGYEAGLYPTDLDVMGMLSFDAWRAARLVVDTGIHAKGWSRDQARRYMAEHTALAANNIDNEVDRYLSWPGQALGYKLGQLEILRLRKELEQALGSRFSLSAFHDALLDDGALTLPLLRQRVTAKLAGAALKP